MLMRLATKKSRSDAGFSLLEILITIMVLSIGLMGVISMQMKGAESTNGAYFRSQATLIVNELAERMHVNLLAVKNNNYADINITPAKDYCKDSRPASFCESDSSSVAVSCNITDMADFDTFRAACDISQRLPTSTLRVVCEDRNLLDVDLCTDGSLHSITVSWNEVDDGNSIATNVSIKVLP